MCAAARNHWTSAQQTIKQTQPGNNHAAGVPGSRLAATTTRSYLARVHRLHMLHLIVPYVHEHIQQALAGRPPQGGVVAAARLQLIELQGSRCGQACSAAMVIITRCRQTQEWVASRSVSDLHSRVTANERYACCTATANCCRSFVGWHELKCDKTNAIHSAAIQPLTMYKSSFL